MVAPVSLGFDVEEPGEINEREKQIAQLFAGARFVAGLAAFLSSRISSSTFPKPAQCRANRNPDAKLFG